MTERKKMIVEIITEMISKDRMVINSEMAREASKRLGEKIDAQTISKIRNEIGLGSYALSSEYMVRKISDRVGHYLKKHPGDRKVVSRFVDEVFGGLTFTPEEFHNY
jgi:hypothetical protein